MVRKAWLIVASLYVVLLIYFVLKIYNDAFIPANQAQSEMTAVAVRAVLLDDFKIKALGGYMDSVSIKRTADSLPIKDRMEFYRLLIQYSYNVKTSSEFAYIFHADIIASDAGYFHDYLINFKKDQAYSAVPIDQRQWLDVWTGMLESEVTN